MKKLFLLFALFTTVCVMNAAAQSTSEELSQTIEKLKEKVKPQLIQKAGITGEQADRVIRIHATYAKRLQTFDNASEAEKTKQREKIFAAENKEYLAMSLTSTQVNQINAVWTDLKKKQSTSK